jgi:hypothetical protein
LSGLLGDSPEARIFLVPSTHHSALKKDSRQTGMTDQKENDEGGFFEQRFTFYS